MPGSPNNSSFIPKQGAVKRRRTNNTQQVYVVEIVSYVMIVAALISAAGVFLYKSYLQNQFNEIVVALDELTRSFSVDDFQKVIDFDERLNQATNRAYNNISFNHVLEAFEQATIEPLTINEFSAIRTGDELIEVTASVQTDSFDSTIFQRNTYGGNDVLRDFIIEDLSVSVRDEQASDVNEIEVSQDNPLQLGREVALDIKFTAMFSVPTNEMFYTGEGVEAVSAVDAGPESVTSFNPTNFFDDIIGETVDSGETDEGVVDNNLQI